MFNLTDLGAAFGFNRSKTEAKFPLVVAVAVPEAMADAYAPGIAEMGYTTKDTVVKDGVAVMKFEDFDMDDASITAVKMQEDVCVLVANTDVEAIKKSYTSYSESASFKENLSQASFFPGLSMSMSVLMDTVGNILMTTEKGDSPTNKIKQALDEFTAFVVQMADEIPSSAFKFEKLTKAELPAKDEKVEEKVAVTEPEASVEKTEEKVEEKEVAAEVEIPAAEDKESELAIALKAIAAKVDTLVTETAGFQKTVSKQLEDFRADVEKRVTKAEETASEASRTVNGTVSVQFPDDHSLGTRRTKEDVQKEEGLFDNLLPFEKIPRVEHY